jgi:hypothetical protein
MNRSAHRAAAAALLALSACGRDAGTGPGPVRRELYVDATAGSDHRDGTGPARAFRTVARALQEIPNAPGGRWTIHLAPGRYPEALRLERFTMPSDLARFQDQAVPPAQSIAIVGDSSAPARVVLAPPDSGQACIVAAGVVLYLSGFTCLAGPYGGVLAAGAALTIDDLAFVADSTSRTALYLDRTTVEMGGRVTVDGPFGVGFAVRTYSLLRSGSPRNPARLTVVFRVPGDGIFLRDFGDVTSAFETDTFRFEGGQVAVHALLGSHAFFTNTVEVEVLGSQVAFHASEGSGVNVHHATVQGVADVFGRCRYQSSIAVEGVTGTVARWWDSDGSCQLRAGALTGS